MDNLYQYLSTHTILIHNDLSKELIEWYMRVSGYADLLGYPFLLHGPVPSVGAQFLSDFLIRKMYYLSNPFIANNLMILSTLIISFCSMYFLSRYLKFSKFLSTNLSLIFISQPYLWYRFLSATSSLYIIFIFPIVILALAKKINPILLGLIVSITFYYSNYYGYFAIILCIFWWAFSYLMDKNLRVIITTIFWFSSSVFLLIGLPQLDKVTHSTLVFGKYDTQSLQTADLEIEIPLRSVEDFFFFSNRPWYHLLPPSDALVGGNLSSDVFSKLKLKGNYLFQNYDAEEAGGEYVAFPILLVLIYTLFKWKSFKFDQDEKRFIYRILFLLLSFEVLSLPPFIIIGSSKLYFPSYLLYVFMPGFRVLVRFAVLNHLFIVMLIGIILHKQFNRRFSQKAVLLGFTVSIVSLNLIHLPWYSINEPPLAVVSELNKSEPVLVAIYPQNDYHLYTDLLLAKVKVINPEYFKDDNSFSADQFTKNLPSDDGLRFARQAGVTHLIFSKSVVKFSSKKHLEAMNFFQAHLKQVYEDKNYLIYAL